MFVLLEGGQVEAADVSEGVTQPESGHEATVEVGVIRVVLVGRCPQVDSL